LGQKSFRESNRSITTEMATAGNDNGADRARESFASLLAFYTDRDSAGSADIQIGVAAGTAPSAEQAEEFFF
jgi:hypothetical protein